MELSAQDFAGALQRLLPPGTYWQDTENSELNKVLEGLGTELKTVHDETELNILYEINTTSLGWRVADFQTLLDDNQLPGRVFDLSSYPNHIYLEVDSTQNMLSIVQLIEQHRLPHTQLVWRLVGQLNITAVARVCHHIRLDATA